MASFSWDQVNAWRLHRHALLERVDRNDRLDIVSQIGGLHAQVASAAELALYARVRNLSPYDVENDLWRDRSLVKAWVMRGTLHLVRAGDLPGDVAALMQIVLPFYHKPAWLKFHQVSREELDAIVAAVRDTLSAVPLTREQLADAIVQCTGRERLRELLLSGWGALLKPAAVQGYLCFGPNREQNVTFVRPDAWLAEWQEADPHQAMQVIARRYLATYGPASADDFGRWWGLEPRQAAKLLKTLGSEIEAVNINGWSAWTLAAKVEEINAASSNGCIRLLPYFDPYTVSLYRHRQYLLAEKYQDRVYRPQGWIAPVVVLDGRIVGIWEGKKGDPQLTVHLFLTPGLELAAGIETEVERLRQFWGNEIQVIYEVND